MTSSRCHLCHAGCTNTTTERIMKCSNEGCESRLPDAAPIDRDDNAVLNIAHRVLAAWLDPEGKSSSALRRPELVPSAAAVVSAAADLVNQLDELDAAEADVAAEDPECADQLVDVDAVAVPPLAATVAGAPAAAATEAQGPSAAAAPVDRRRRTRRL
jgi:hypothetical protein